MKTEDENKNICKEEMQKPPRMATQNNDAEAVKFHEIFDNRDTGNGFNNYNPKRENRLQKTMKQTPSREVLTI